MLEKGKKKAKKEKKAKDKEKDKEKKKDKKDKKEKKKNKEKREKSSGPRLFHPEDGGLPKLKIKPVTPVVKPPPLPQVSPFPPNILYLRYMAQIENMYNNIFWVHWTKVDYSSCTISYWFWFLFR